MLCTGTSPISESFMYKHVYNNCILYPQKPHIYRFDGKLIFKVAWDNLWPRHMVRELTLGLNRLLIGGTMSCIFQCLCQCHDVISAWF